MSRARLILSLAIVVSLAGCVFEPFEGWQEPGTPGRGAVTYSGDIPCADCPGQRVTLTLFEDGTYRMRRIYQATTGGRDESHHDLGRWTRTADDPGRLKLRGGKEGTRDFGFVGTDRLRMLDSDGREIRAAQPYDLTRRPTVDPVNDPMRLRGIYTFVADVPAFSECLTGARVPVSLDAGHAELERAYLQQRRQPGEPILATLTGRFVERPQEPGQGPKEYLVVERFDRLWPGETCAREASAQVALLNTYWWAVEIDGRPVTVDPDVRGPHLLLASAGNDVRGATGCGTLTGSFEQGADSFRFVGLATSRPTCPSEVDYLETRFLNALNATASERVVGATLELYDASGTLRVLLEATSPR